MPYGIMMAACTIVGNQIGEGNVAAAKYFNKHINCFALGWWIIEFLLLYSLFDTFWVIFSEDKLMNKMRDEVFLLAMIGLLIGFPQVYLGGPLKGLGL